jgi:DNA-binding transcriptional MerR regulator
MYTEATFERIRLVKALQALGFTLDEVIDALRTVDERGLDSCSSQRWRLEAVLERLDRKIEEVQRVREGVVKVLNECHAGQCALQQGEIASGEAPIPRNGIG